MINPRLRGALADAAVQGGNPPVLAPHSYFKHRETYGYPSGTTRNDLLRGLGGSGVCAALVYSEPMPGISAVLTILGVLFLVHGWRCVQRHRAMIHLDPGRMVVDSGTGAPIRSWTWNQLEAVRLGYYSTRRDGERGWWELKMKLAGETVRVDGGLECFDDFVARITERAQAIDLVFDSTTDANLRAMGLRW